MLLQVAIKEREFRSGAISFFRGSGDHVVLAALAPRSIPRPEHWPGPSFVQFLLYRRLCINQYVRIDFVEVISLRPVDLLVEFETEV